MTSQPPPDRARQGDPQALCDWLAQQTPASIIAIQAQRQERLLRLLLDLEQPTDPESVTAQVHQYLLELELESTEQVQVYGRLQGESIPQWYREILLPLRASSRQPSRIERAQNAEPEAIAEVITYLLKPEGIRSRVHYSRRAGLLQVILLAQEQVPDQETSVDKVAKIVAKLQLTFVKTLRIAGQKQGSFLPSWSQDLDLSQDPSFWSSVTRSASQTAGAIVKTGAQMSQTLMAGVTSTGTALVNAGSQASQAVVNTTVTLGKTVGTATTATTQTLGSMLDWIGTTPYLHHMARSFNVDWLAQLIEQVDVIKAEAYVHHLQDHHPEETPAQIAHRLMVEKAMIAAGTGVASTLIPGLSLATLALDLAANLALEAEMVYQIAAAYGLDLADPGRKGEVLAIFGISLGGAKALQVGSSYAARAGLSFLKAVPITGSVIAASTNAALLYALGYGACRYYEAKLDPQMSPITLTAYEAAGENYLASTLPQEQIMDQILLHLILAGHPDTTPAELLPTLASAQISPVSLGAITQHLDSPPDLEALLAQLTPDFAIPLLVQCQRVAAADGVITPQEAEILKQIRSRGQILTASLADYPEVQALTYDSE